MDKQIVVKITENFERNLSSIEHFLLQADVPHVFDGLLDGIAEKIIPNLERFPEIGKLFIDKAAKSVEASGGLDALKKKLAGANLHEYLFQDYLILYARYNEIIYLLSIRHHRQLSFDFNSHWSSQGISQL